MNPQRWPRVVIMGLIRLYQLTFAHLMFTHCRFTPTCSHYTYDAVARHGVVKGTWLGAKRLARCHPFHPGGFDPVP